MAREVERVGEEGAVSLALTGKPALAFFAEEDEKEGVARMARERTGTAAFLLDLDGETGGDRVAPEGAPKVARIPETFALIGSPPDGGASPERL